jgi:hypothetical protein
MPNKALTSLAYRIDIDWLKEAYRRTAERARGGATCAEKGRVSAGYFEVMFVPPMARDHRGACTDLPALRTNRAAP